MRINHTLTYFILLVFGFICICNAQIPESVIQEIDKRITTETNPSIAVGFYSEGESHFYVNGYKNIATKEKATTETLYEIGSITKTFTSLLLAQMREQNLLDINDPISRYLPDSLILNDDKDTAITFRHLATHTSGLLRLPFGYNPDDWNNPYKGYHREQLFRYLSKMKPSEVGSSFAYSNLGFGLLGETLAMIADEPYTDLIHREILKPLSLDNTYFVIPESEARHRAIAYKEGVPTSQWDFDVMAPAGALRSDIGDLLKYGVSYLQEHPLASAQQLVRQTHFNSEQGMEHGLAWFKEKNQIFHGGGTGGFRTYLVIDFNTQQVVAIATNTADNDAADLANYILDPNMKPSDLTELAEVAIGESDLEIYTGTYTNDQFGMNFQITSRDGTLFVKLNTQNALPTTYVGDHTFKNESVKARIVFSVTDGEATELTLFQGGRQLNCIKQ
ncbi:MAG: serine hydrolase [Flavobacteriaceae bacterium]|nr:serine hydrolase [Flavobacteriaceae bacterium]